MAELGINGRRPLLWSMAEGAAKLAALRTDPLRRSFPDPFGDASLATALSALVRSYEAEADLSAIGRFAAAWDVKRFLANLHRLAAEEAHTPEILDEPIEAPIIITGLPRSGSTFLHTLLLEDPGNQAPRCWQTIYPYPMPERWGRSRRDPRAGRVDRQLRWFARLTPNIRGAYPMDSHTPQECTEITAHVFQSLRFDATHHVPSYRRWLDGRGHDAAYRFHKRFLQHLQHQSLRRRWILKSPDHIQALEALAAVYPDARLVFLHRDPLKVLPSVAQLTETLRLPFTRRIDRLQIGRQVVGDWTRGAAHMVEATRSGRFPPEQLFHLHARDLVSRPLDAIARLYRHFGMKLEDAAADRIARRVAARPNGGYGRNRYTFGRHGIDPDEVRHNFRDYMAYFDIAPETDGAPIADRPRQSLLGAPLRS